MREVITSRQNERVKALAALGEKLERFMEWMGQALEKRGGE